MPPRFQCAICSAILEERVVNGRPLRSFHGDAEWRGRSLCAGCNLAVHRALAARGILERLGVPVSAADPAVGECGCCGERKESAEDAVCRKCAGMISAVYPRLRRAMGIGGL